MVVTTTNVQQLTQNFDDDLANELAELDAARLRESMRLRRHQHHQQQQQPAAAR
jgi:hypothetical protein